MPVPRKRAQGDHRFRSIRNRAASRRCKCLYTYIGNTHARFMKVIGASTKRPCPCRYPGLRSRKNTTSGSSVRIQKCFARRVLQPTRRMNGSTFWNWMSPMPHRRLRRHSLNTKRLPIIGPMQSMACMRQALAREIMRNYLPVSGSRPWIFWQTSLALQDSPASSSCTRKTDESMFMLFFSVQTPTT